MKKCENSNEVKVSRVVEYVLLVSGNCLASEIKFDTCVCIEEEVVSGL